MTRQRNREGPRRQPGISAQATEVNSLDVIAASTNDCAAPVRAEGFEPSRSLKHRHLKPACLPFRRARNARDRTAHTLG